MICHPDRVNHIGPVESHLCGHINGRRRSGGRLLGRCTNLVADGSGLRYCWVHRDGWRERWAQYVGAPHTLRFHQRAFAEAPVRIPAPRPAATPSRREAAARDRLKLAVDEARTIVTPYWQRVVERRVAVSLGPALFWQMRAAGGLCDDIAELANCLSRHSDHGDRALERVLTPRMLALLHSPAVTKLVARNFAAQTVPAPSTSTAALVNALRALGVLLCVLDGRDLVRCRCLWALARHEHEQTVRNDVRMVVRYGLDRIPAAWMVVESAR